MFSYLPFPVFISISILVIFGCTYYAVKYKREQNKLLFGILLLCIASCLLTVVAKCLEEWAEDSVFFWIFMYVSIISGVFLIVGVLIIGIHKLFQKNDINVNKPILISGILMIVAATLITGIILSIK